MPPKIASIPGVFTNAMAASFALLGQLPHIVQCLVVVLSTEIVSPISVFVFQDRSVRTLIIEDEETAAFLEPFERTRDQHPVVTMQVSTEPDPGEDFHGAEGVIVGVQTTGAYITNARLQELFPDLALA